MAGRTTSQRWREAAVALREHANKWDVYADEAERAEGRGICGVVSESGPNREPLACGFKPGHDGAHAWSTLPTFTPGAAHYWQGDHGVANGGNVATESAARTAEQYGELLDRLKES